MTENYFNYFTEIEEHFIRKRGRHLLISPLDWCLVELWKENGIPLHVALRGIDRSFEKAEKKKKRTPLRLFYCHPAVMEAFEEFKDSTLGSSESILGTEEPPLSGLSEEDVEAFIEKLLRRLEERPDKASGRAAGRLGEVLEEIHETERLDFEEIDRSIGNIGRDLIADLSEEMKSDDLKQLKKEVRAELKRYRRRISKEMYARLQERHLERKLSDRFELPEFSLLRIDSARSV